jgi:hypothetical protein
MQQKQWKMIRAVLNIRNLNNAVMGFWTVQRGLIRQFFTHNTYNLICIQLFNPNMQADLPWQTFTQECQIELPNRIVKSNLFCQTELPNCQIEFVLPNRIKPNCQTELPNWIAKPNCQTELPNWIAELNCQTELPNWIAKPNCQTELPNRIAELNCRRNCHAKWIAELILNLFC